MTADKHLALRLCHWAVATPTNVLGGKTDQDLGSLPPKLHVLSAAFAVELGLVTHRLFRNLR